MLPPEEDLLSDQDHREASIEQLVNLRDLVNLALQMRAGGGRTDAARGARAPTTRRESGTSGPRLEGMAKLEPTGGHRT
jgi:hypothetical protein